MLLVFAKSAKLVPVKPPNKDVVVDDGFWASPSPLAGCSVLGADVSTADARKEDERSKKAHKCHENSTKWFEKIIQPQATHTFRGTKS